MGLQVSCKASAKGPQVLNTVPLVVVLYLTKQRIAGTVESTAHGAGAMVVVEHSIQRSTRQLTQATSRALLLQQLIADDGNLGCLEPPHS